MHGWETRMLLKHYLERGVAPWTVFVRKQHGLTPIGALCQGCSSWGEATMRRIELTEGQPCACVAKTDRERDGESWRIVCRDCGDVWWWGLVVVAESRPVPKHGRGRGIAARAS